MGYLHYNQIIAERELKRIKAFRRKKKIQKAKDAIRLVFTRDMLGLMLQKLFGIVMFAICIIVYPYIDSIEAIVLPLLIGALLILDNEKIITF